MLKQTLGALGLGVVVLLVAATDVDAQYEGNNTVATVSDTTPAPGEPLTVHFEGFDPNTSVSGQLNSAPVPLGTKTTSATGAVDFTFTVPTTFAPGETHTVTATGTRGGQPLTLTASFTVAGQAAAGAVPTTGSSSSLPLSRVGIALVAVGGIAVYLSRRRRLAAA